MSDINQFTICHITTFCSGGVITVINNLIKEQSKYNNICLIFPQECINDVKTNCKEIIDNSMVKLFPVKRSKLFSKKILFGVLPNKIKQKLKKDYNNKIIFHYHNISSIGLFNKIFVKNSICTIHGIDVANQKKLFYKHLYKLFFRKKIKFCGVSNHTTSYYQKYSRKKIYTIYNGLSSTNIQNIKYQYSIGFIGVMDSHKGWKYLYDAYNYLTDDLKDKVTFKFYGNILKEDCNNFKDDNNHLLYCGYSTDINLELEKLDAIVLPSISEGLPMSLLEAMRLSKPILATKVGGIPEMLYDGINGFIIERDPQNIATKIEKLYSNIDDYKKMAKNSYYIFNGKFKIEKIAKEYYNLYLMENKKGD